MNSIQRAVLVLTAVLVMTMLLYPPFVVSLANGAQVNKGYSMLFSPPTHGAMVAVVNVSMLLAQIAGVIICAGLVGYALRTSPSGSQLTAGASNDMSATPLVATPTDATEVSAGADTSASSLANGESLPTYTLMSTTRTSRGKSLDAREWPIVSLSCVVVGWIVYIGFIHYVDVRYFGTPVSLKTAIISSSLVYLFFVVFAFAIAAVIAKLVPAWRSVSMSDLLFRSWIVVACVLAILANGYHYGAMRQTSQSTVAQFDAESAEVLLRKVVLSAYDEPIPVLVPSSMISASDHEPKIIDVFAQLSGLAQVPIEAFVSEADLGRFRSGELLGDNYIVVYSFPDDSPLVNDTDWIEIKRGFQGALASKDTQVAFSAGSDAAESALKTLSGGAASASFGTEFHGQVFESGNDAILFYAIVHVTIDVRGVPVERTQVIASAMLRVGHRMLKIDDSSPYIGPESVSSSKARLRQVVRYFL